MGDEEFYDTEIAPGMLALAKKCEERGLPFVAKVWWWNNSDGGMTFFVPPNSDSSVHVAYMGVACKGNVDSLFIGIKRYAKEHGHTSMVMELAP